LKKCWTKNNLFLLNPLLLNLPKEGFKNSDNPRFLLKRRIWGVKFGNGKGKKNSFSLGKKIKVPPSNFFRQPPNKFPCKNIKVGFFPNP